MTVRSVLTESFDATKRQDPVLREDVMLLLECGPEVLAYSERPAARAAATCPDHRALALIPCPGGAARGICPADGRTYQFEAPEVSW